MNHLSPWPLMVQSARTHGDSAGERIASALLTDGLLATAVHLNHALRILAAAAGDVEVVRLCDQMTAKLDGGLKARAQEHAGLAVLEMSELVEGGGLVQ